MYLSRVSLENIRSFKDGFTIDFEKGVSLQSERRLRTVVIGENGTGKTTLLRAIAVGIADRQDASGLVGEPTGQFVAEGASAALIKVRLKAKHSQNTVNVTTKIRNDHGQDVVDEKEPHHDPDFLVCGYGVSRANEGPETGRPYRIIDSVYTLFQYEHTLVQTELTLRRLKDFLDEGRYEKVLTRIKEVLGLDSNDEISLPRGGGVKISGSRIGRDIPLEGWADGYRKTLAWILDLYAWAMRANCITTDGDVTGIVLLDEMEQHLHPSMQIRLASKLSALLPHVQMIATTHSPLVALGVSPEELIVLKRDGAKVVAHESVIDFHGYSVEDMLSDPKLFNSDVYGPEMSQKLEKYHRLAGKPEPRRSSQDRDELRKLASELAAQEIPGFRENPAMNELREILRKFDL